MNQDFTEKKATFVSKKIRAEGFTWKKNSCTNSELKKNRASWKFPSPAPHHFSNGPSLKWGTKKAWNERNCRHYYHKIERTFNRKVFLLVGIFNKLSVLFTTFVSRFCLNLCCNPEYHDTVTKVFYWFPCFGRATEYADRCFLPVSPFFFFPSCLNDKWINFSLFFGTTLKEVSERCQ